MFHNVGTIAAILAGGVVLWWFIKPGSQGVTFLGGMFGNITAFFRYLFGEPIRQKTISINTQAPLSINAATLGIGA
jgi:hypothetical protein